MNSYTVFDVSRFRVSLTNVVLLFWWFGRPSAVDACAAHVDHYFKTPIKESKTRTLANISLHTQLTQFPKLKMYVRWQSILTRMILNIQRKSHLLTTFSSEKEVCNYSLYDGLLGFYSLITFFSTFTLCFTNSSRLPYTFSFNFNLLR